MELSTGTVEAERAAERVRFLRQLGEEALLQAPITQQVAALADKLDQLVGRSRLRRQVDSSKLLLSKSEAARCLGIDRKTTLRDLIATKAIRTVKGPRGRRVPRSEVDRLLAMGIPRPGESRRSIPRHRPAQQAP